MNRYLLLLFFIFSSETHATAFNISGLTIDFIRSVGNYYQSTTFDNTVELWFTSELNFPSSLSCTENRRIYIDASYSHLVSAAYMAFLSGKTVDVQLDDSLPIRNGTCEISYIDVNN